MADYDAEDKSFDDRVGNFAIRTSAISYLRHTRIEISSEALLAGYFSLWLWRWVVPGGSGLVDRLHRNVLFYVVRLVFKHRLALLPAMVSHLNTGLRELAHNLVVDPL